MSTRNPTTYNAWLDEITIYPGKDIVTTTPSAVADDQTFILDQQECVISDHWPGFLSTAAAFETITVYNFEGTDICNASESSTGAWPAANTINYECFCIVWNSDGATTGELKVTSNAAATNTATFSILVGHTSKTTWRAFDVITVPTNTTVASLTLEVKRTGGVGYIFVAAFAAFSSIN